jgi:hypothetical protein
VGKACKYLVFFFFLSNIKYNKTFAVLSKKIIFHKKNIHRSKEALSFDMFFNQNRSVQ